MSPKGGVQRRIFTGLGVWDQVTYSESLKVRDFIRFSREKEPIGDTYLFEIYDRNWLM